MNSVQPTPEGPAIDRPTVTARCARIGRTMFGIDLRSLAAFRIGVALIVLMDLWYRSREISAFFTDDGILPRHVLISLNEIGSQFRFQDAWSLHMCSGQYWGQLLLFLMAACFAVWLLVGYRTQLAAIATWILLLSLDARNPDILNSGDVLLRCMLLWSLFLPLGGVWSVDRLIHRPQSALPGRVFSMASAALLLQLGLMYLFSAIAKMHPVWHTDFSGVYFALHCDAYVKPLGIVLRDYSGLTKLLTAGSFGLELIGPILVFLPFWNARLRIALVAMFWLFHVGLGMTLTLGLFPIICIVCWILFLPGEFWEALVSRVSRWAMNSPLSGLIRTCVIGAVTLRRRAKSGRSYFLQRAETARWRDQGIRYWLINGILASLLAYVVLWNVREVVLRNTQGWDAHELAPRVLPFEVNGVGRALGLDQNWGMFSPIPRTEDGWLVMKGTLRDGTEVNLWQHDRPLPWEKPVVVSATYVSQRWRKYLDNLSTDPYALRRLDFCEWLGRRWNRQQAAADPSREVVLIELIHQIEATPPPGDPFPELETRPLYDYRPLYYD